MRFAPGYVVAERPDPDHRALVDEAVELAGGSDIVVMFLGLPPAYESEGFDHTHLGLAAAQLELLEAVHRANPRIVVVLVNGSVVDVASWRDSAARSRCWPGRGRHVRGDGRGHGDQRRHPPGCRGRAGVYVSDVESSVARPPRELRSFARVELDARESRRVELDAAPRSLRYACATSVADCASSGYGRYRVRAWAAPGPPVER